MSLTKATFSMISGAPINVLDYIPPQYHAAILSYNTATVVDVRQYVQAAIDACPQGHTVYFPAGLYKIVPVDVSGTKIGLKLYASSGHNGIRLLGDSDGYFSSTVQSTTLWFTDTNAYGIDVVNQSTVIQYFTMCYAFNGVRPSGTGSAIRVGNSTTKVYGCMVKDCWFTEIPSSAVYVINGFVYFNTSTVELSRFGVFVDATLYDQRPSAWVWDSQIVGCDVGVALIGSATAEIVAAQISNNQFGSNGVGGNEGDIYIKYANSVQIVGNLTQQSQSRFLLAENCTQCTIASNQGSLFDKEAMYFLNGTGNSITGNNMVGFDATGSNTFSGLVIEGTESNYTIDANTIVGSYTTPNVFGLFGLRVVSTQPGFIGSNQFAGKTAPAVLPAVYDRVYRQAKTITGACATTDATPITILSVTSALIPSAYIDNNFQIEVNVIGSGASGVFASYKQVYCVRISSLNAWSISATASLVSQESDAAFDCAGSTASGSSFDLVVTGKAGTNITWNAEVILRGIGQI